MNSVCIHAHIYQPPRENPWTGTWAPQPGAAPWPDWNTRITAECYAPGCAARLLDGLGNTRAVRNVWQSVSLDIGPVSVTL